MQAGPGARNRFREIEAVFILKKMGTLWGQFLLDQHFSQKKGYGYFP